jgi:hypothetical protein
MAASWPHRGRLKKDRTFVVGLDGFVRSRCPCGGHPFGSWPSRCSARPEQLVPHLPRRRRVGRVALEHDLTRPLALRPKSARDVAVLSCSCRITRYASTGVLLHQLRAPDAYPVFCAALPSTSFTLPSNAVALNGLATKFVPGSSVPWCTIALSVYPDV